MLRWLLLIGRSSMFFHDPNETYSKHRTCFHHRNYPSHGREVGPSEDEAALQGLQAH